MRRNAQGVIDIYRRNQDHRAMTIRDYFGNAFGIEYYYRHPRSYARRGIFSIDEPSPTIRGVNRPVPAGYPGHPGDAAPVNAPGLRPLTTLERSRIQTFPADWELVGNKSHVEQIVGNAVPCALGEFVGTALSEFAEMPRRPILANGRDSVSVFFQHENRQDDDIQVVAI